MPKTLSEYYTSKGQALPSVTSRAGDAAKAGITGAYIGSADQNNQLLSYYQNTQNVPTSAPSAPTPVVGSNLATNQVNKITDTLNTSNTAITKSQMDAQAAKDKATTDAAIKYANDQKNKTITTPEQDIANQPDTGNQWIYDKTTGEKTQVPVGSNIPSNYTTVDVKSAPAVDTTTSADGNITFKQLGDGSYAKYDTGTGQYVGMSNKTQFDLMKTGQSAAKAYQDAIANGPLLNDSQKAQIQSITDAYQRLITQQATDNANFTGGTTVAQNLYGIGNTIMGAGQIKGVIDAGAAKIADLNSKMNSDVAKMTQAFQSDNLNVLKDAYKSFQENSSSLQKAIDTAHAEATQLERDSKQQSETARNQIDNDIRTLQTNMLTSGASAIQKAGVAAALANHDYNAAVTAAGDSLKTATGWMGEYYNYAKEMETLHPGTPIMDPVEYKNWDDNNKINAANLAAGGPSTAAGAGNAPFQATIDNVLGSINGVKEHDREAERLGQLAVNGNYSDLLQALKSRVKTSQLLTAADKSDLNNAEKQIPAADRMSQAIKDYQAVGGDMSYLKGKADSIDSYFGKLGTDPKYKALATELTIAFQNYRQQMTGAAFGAAESKEYGSVVPTKDKSFELNAAIIDGLKNYMQGRVDDTYTSALGEGYTNLKGLVEQQKNNDPVKMETDATSALQQYIQSNPTKKDEINNKIKIMETTTGKPMSSSDFLQAFPEYGGKTSFNSVGSDTNTASIQIPKSTLAYKNNNPGNLRFASQQGAIQGEGGFAKFSSPEAGVKALSNQIDLDAERGHTVESFISKYAPSTENNTKEYLSQILKFIGAKPNTLLSNIDKKSLLKAIALKESSTKIL